MSVFHDHGSMQQASYNLGEIAVSPDTTTDHVDRPRRNRAAKACTSCRERKIRCDVSSIGLPCSNCSINHRHCLTKERVRRRRADRHIYLAAPFGEVDSFSFHLPKVPHHTFQVQTSLSDTSSRICNPVASEQLVVVPKINDVQINNKKIPGFSHPEFMLESLQAHNFEHDPCLDVSNAASSHMHRAKPAATEGTFKLSNHYSQSQSSCLHTESYDESEITYSDYGFLKSHAVSDLPGEDVQYLEQLKCFHAPIRPILDEIMRSFFLHVQPHFPIFDEAMLWTSYNTDCGEVPITDRMSIFTFQAFLCVACSFSDHTVLQNLQLNGPRQARNRYYRKAKALFDLGAEKNSLAISQGALLLTYFTPRTDSTANSYWLGVAIEHARRIQAHEFHSRHDLSICYRAQLKRLWWCCILRDTTLSLGLRRPVHIPWNASTERLSVLNQEDFENEIHYSAVYDSPTKRSLVELLSLFCEFSLCLLEVLELLYPKWKAMPYTILSHDAGDVRRCRLQACESKMTKWYQKASNSQEAPFNQQSSENSLILLKNLIRMAYHSAKVAIYNDAILEATVGPMQINLSLNSWSSHGVLLEQEVFGITRCLMEVLKANLIGGLPVSVVAFAALPLVWYVMGSKLTATQEISALRDYVHVYTKTMKACQSIYEGADAVVENVARLMKNIRLKSLQSTSHNEIEISGLRFTSQSKKCAPLGTKAQRATSEWISVLLGQPGIYASIITTIDIALSSGHYPTLTDLPVALQMAQDGGVFPLYTSLPLKSAQIASSAADQDSRSCEASWNDSRNSSERNGTYTFSPLLASEMASTVAYKPSQNLIAWHDRFSMPQGSWAQMHNFQQLSHGYGEAGTAD